MMSWGDIWVLKLLKLGWVSEEAARAAFDGAGNAICGVEGWRCTVNSGYEPRVMNYKTRIFMAYR